MPGRLCAAGGPDEKNDAIWPCGSVYLLCVKGLTAQTHAVEEAGLDHHLHHFEVATGWHWDLKIGLTGSSHRVKLIHPSRHHSLLAIVDLYASSFVCFVICDDVSSFVTMLSTCDDAEGRAVTML
jgi:hypothetical protein